MLFLEAFHRFTLLKLRFAHVYYFQMQVVQPFLVKWSQDEKDIYSEIQIQICEFKAEGHSYEEMVDGFGLSGNCSVSSCIKAAFSENKWFPGI